MIVRWALITYNSKIMNKRIRIQFFNPFNAKSRARFWTLVVDDEIILVLYEANKKR